MTDETLAVSPAIQPLPAVGHLHTAVVLRSQGYGESPLRLLRAAKLRVDFVDSPFDLEHRVPADLLVIDQPADCVRWTVEHLSSLNPFARPHLVLFACGDAEDLATLQQAWGEVQMFRIPRPLHLHGLLRLLRISQHQMALTA